MSTGPNFLILQAMHPLSLQCDSPSPRFPSHTHTITLKYELACGCMPSEKFGAVDRSLIQRDECMLEIIAIPRAIDRAI